MPDKHIKSIVKAFTWRFIATCTTMSIVWFYTGELTLTLEVGALDVVLKLIFYYLHERAWSKPAWGTK